MVIKSTFDTINKILQIIYFLKRYCYVDSHWIIWNLCQSFQPDKFLSHLFRNGLRWCLEWWWNGSNYPRNVNVPRRFSTSQPLVEAGPTSLDASTRAVLVNSNVRWSFLVSLLVLIYQYALFGISGPSNSLPKTIVSSSRQFWLVINLVGIRNDATNNLFNISY